MSKRRKSVSDQWLMKLWRQAVLVHWDYTDPLSGHRDPTGESLQCHHIVKRRHVLLRWDYRNGVPLTVESHEAAHTGAGHARLRDLVDSEYLDNLERYTGRDWLQEHGLSPNEFRLAKKRELQDVIGGSE